MLRNENEAKKIELYVEIKMMIKCRSNGLQIVGTFDVVSCLMM